MANPFNFKGTQFASFTYTNKQGEVSNYLVQLGGVYKKGLEKNIEKLKSASFEDEAWETARLEMIETMTANLNPKTANNRSKAQSDTYEHLHKGVKMHVGKKSPALNGNIYIGCNVVKKTQTAKQKAQTEINIASGNFEPKKPKTKTVKSEISKVLDLHYLGFSNFKFAKGSLESARINGEIIEL